MHVEIIGSEGVMGKRYDAILKHLRTDIITRTDPLYKGANKLVPANHVIVASPTHTHFDILWDLIEGNRANHILCEKPICMESRKVQVLADHAAHHGKDVRMVSNWYYAITRALQHHGEVANMGEMEIEYRYYNSGKDGFFWDCIQPIYMAGKFKYDRRAPIFDCKANGIPVTLDDFSHSYPMMISEWLYGDKKKLWSLQQAVEATRKVEAMGEPAEWGEVSWTTI